MSKLLSLFLLSLLWLGIGGRGIFATELPENCLDFVYFNDEKIIFGRPIMPEAVNKRGAEILIGLQLADANYNVSVTLSTIGGLDKVNALRSVLTPWLLDLGAKSVYFRSLETAEIIGAPVMAVPEKTPEVKPEQPQPTPSADDEVIITKPAPPVKLQPMEKPAAPEKPTPPEKIKTATPQEKVAIPETKTDLVEPETETDVVKPETNVEIPKEVTPDAPEIPQLPSEPTPLPNPSFDLPTDIIEPLKTTTAPTAQPLDATKKTAEKAASEAVKRIETDAEVTPAPTTPTPDDLLPPMLRALPENNPTPQPNK